MLRKDDRTYVIDRDGSIERITPDRVTYAPPPDPNAGHEATTEQHDIVNNKEGPSYVVDAILGHRKDAHGSLEFHVRWYCYNEITWEIRCNIPEELVSRYFTKQARTPRALTVIVDS